MLRLLLSRLQDGSAPGSRSDGFKLGLVVEGGGMRGIVTGAMLMGLQDMGLVNVFDSVYGEFKLALASQQWCVGDGSRLAGFLPGCAGASVRGWAVAWLMHVLSSGPKWWSQPAVHPRVSGSITHRCNGQLDPGAGSCPTAARGVLCSSSHSAQSAASKQAVLSANMQTKADHITKAGTSVRIRPQYVAWLLLLLTAGASAGAINSTYFLSGGCAHGWWQPLQLLKHSHKYGQLY